MGEVVVIAVVDVHINVSNINVSNINVSNINVSNINVSDVRRGIGDGITGAHGLTVSRSAGYVPVLAFHASAAPRWAIRRVTAMATPEATAQMSASDHRVLGEAGLVGGSPPIVRRQQARSSARVAEPAATPLSDPTAFHRSR
ncbi:MAG: hypothetical protein M3450_02260 [Actinomycetota bacterium]|nr:hypothetical protein [Actinomycetota bacterium]